MNVIDPTNDRNVSTAAITRVSAGAAIARERETRHWTIEQRREAFGDHWPSESARITREADAAVDFLVNALDGLRSAWNAHFETCPTPTPDLPAPSWEDLQAWRDAPSGTASA